MKKLRAAGFEITAVHNHVLNETPRVIYMHYMGHGKAVELAKSLHAGLAESKTPLDKPAAPAPPAEPPVFVKAIEDHLGHERPLCRRCTRLRDSSFRGDHGSRNDTDHGARRCRSHQFPGGWHGQSCDNGGFVLTSEEVNPVISALEENDIAVTALHSHMMTEQPRLLFMHFWAVGKHGIGRRGNQGSIEPCSGEINPVLGSPKGGRNAAVFLLRSFTLDVRGVVWALLGFPPLNIAMVIALRRLRASRNQRRNRCRWALCVLLITATLTSARSGDGPAVKVSPTSSPSITLDGPIERTRLGEMRHQ